MKLPSLIYDKKYVRMPEGNVIDSDDEWSRCGMWILINHSRKMSWIDEVWSKLQVLLKKGTLLMIKASTSAMLNNPTDPGTILCYTRPGEKEIEHAANEIRKIVHYEACMYYKVNRVTQNNVGIRYGHKRISHYMHTFKGFFYKSNSELEWVLVNNERANQRKSSFSMDINSCEKIDFDKLPSKSRENFLAMRSKSNTIDLFGACIIISCRLGSVENNLCEADRLWIVARKLIKERDIVTVTCKRKCNLAEFRLFLLDKLNILSIVKICEKIYHQSEIVQFIYICEGKTKYRYSPEKELYEDFKFVNLEQKSYF